MIMRTNIIIVACFLTFTSIGALAQQEPQYVNQFFFLDSSSGKLMPLERQNANMKAKAKAFGIGGSSSFYEVKGDKSKVRFKAGKPMEFVVRGIPRQVDPSQMIQMVQFDIKKGKRRWQFGGSGAFGTNAGTTFEEGAIMFNAAPYGKESLKISPAEPLKPGEYGISAAMGQQYFCFGVD
jgi:hypothetical protein